MFGTDGNTVLTLTLIAAAMLAAAVCVVAQSRKVRITANIISTVLVMPGTFLTLYFWDLDISWLGRIALVNCSIVWVLVVLSFFALFPDREEQVRQEALAKLGITGN